MNIFKKRPLSLILCIMVGGFSLFIDAGLVFKYVLIGLATLLFVSTFIFKGIFNQREVLTRIGAIAFIISLLLGMLFNFIYAPKTISGDAPIRALVKDVDYSNSSETTASVTIIEYNNSRVSYEALITADKDSLINVGRGDEIEFKGTLVSFWDEDSKGASYYRARGYQAEVKGISNLVVTSGAFNYQPNIFTEMRRNICDSLKLATNSQTGAFLSALITGEQSSLDANTALNFTLIGISHILALSGAHLVILADALRRILSLFKLNKRVVVIISTLFAVFYMFLTGCSPSIVRATVMLIITNGLFLLSSTHDTYTTLPIAVFMILVFQPYAVFDVSLWLSAFATLGVVVLADITAKKKDEPQPERKRIISALIWLRDAILATAFAIICTYLITAQFADKTSLLSPITTLIFSLPTTILIYIGLFTLIVPFGAPAIILSDAVLELAEVFASQKWAIISLEFPLVIALTLISGIAFMSFLVFKLDKIRLATYILVGLYALSLIVGVVQTQIATLPNSTQYKTTSQADKMIFRSNGVNTLIYNGIGNDIEIMSTIKELKENKIYYLDNLIFPSYTYNIVNLVEALTASIKIDTVYIPSPMNEDELSYFEALMDKLSISGAEPKLYNENEEISLGNIAYKALTRVLMRDAPKPCHIFELNINGTEYTYFSQGAFELLEGFAHSIANNSRGYLILGRYGASYSKDFCFTIPFENIKGVLCISDALFADHVKEYYKSKEVSITVIDTSFIIH